MPKWSVIVEGRELPARPLVLEAAGVPPNDPTNSHQAVAILQQMPYLHSIPRSGCAIVLAVIDKKKTDGRSDSACRSRGDEF